MERHRENDVEWKGGKGNRTERQERRLKAQILDSTVVICTLTFVQKKTCLTVVCPTRI
jgi:hypothetical protein